MPWHHRWNVLAVGLLFQALSFGIGIYCFTFYVAPWSAEFSVGRREVMLVFLGLQLALGAFAPFAGRAMDRLSIRALVCVGALCLALALALSARATQLWQLGLLHGTLVVAGILLAGPLAAQKLVTRWFDERRGLALGLSTVGTSLGGLALPPLVAALQAAYGWRRANDWLAGIVLVAVVPLVWAVVRNGPAEAEAGTRPPAARDAAVQAPDPSWSAADVLRTGTFWLIVLVFTALGTAFGGVKQNLAPFALDRGIPPQAAAWLISTMALVMALAKVGFGALADRVDVRWLLGAALAVLALALVWMTRPVGYAELAAVCGLLGLAAGANLPLLATVVSRRFGAASFGLVMGLVGPFSAASALGPLLASHVRDVAGDYAPAWLALGALLAPAALATALLRPERARGTLATALQQRA
jgi:MFS family permease